MRTSTFTTAQWFQFVIVVLEHSTKITFSLLIFIPTLLGAFSKIWWHVCKKFLVQYCFVTVVQMFISVLTIAIYSMYSFRKLFRCCTVTSCRFTFSINLTYPLLNPPPQKPPFRSCYCLVSTEQFVKNELLEILKLLLYRHPFLYAFVRTTCTNIDLCDCSHKIQFLFFAMHGLCGLYMTVISLSFIQLFPR